MTVQLNGDKQARLPGGRSALTEDAHVFLAWVLARIILNVSAPLASFLLVPVKPHMTLITFNILVTLVAASSTGAAYVCYTSLEKHGGIRTMEKDCA